MRGQVQHSHETRQECKSCCATQHVQAALTKRRRARGRAARGFAGGEGGAEPPPGSGQLRHRDAPASRTPSPPGHSCPGAAAGTTPRNQTPEQEQAGPRQHRILGSDHPSAQGFCACCGNTHHYTALRSSKTRLKMLSLIKIRITN